MWNRRGSTKKNDNEKKNDGKSEDQPKTFGYKVDSFGGVSKCRNVYVFTKCLRMAIIKPNRTIKLNRRTTVCWALLVMVDVNLWKV